MAQASNVGTRSANIVGVALVVTGEGTLTCALFFFFFPFAASIATGTPSLLIGRGGGGAAHSNISWSRNAVVDATEIRLCATSSLPSSR